MYDFQDDDFNENKQIEEETSAKDKSCDFVDVQVINIQSQPEIIDEILRAPIQFDDDISEKKQIQQDKTGEEKSVKNIQSISEKFL